MKNSPWNAEPQLGIIDKKAKLGLGASREVKWYSRGYLPHLDDRNKVQSITFRLADSLPQKKFSELEERLTLLQDNQRETVRRKAIEKWLDAGMGCCALGHPVVAGIVEETLLKFDGVRYRLLAWCIMPNHVHVLINPEDKLGKIVQSWKSYPGRWALKRNAELGLGVPGKKFWMREYWDRYIRNENHLERVVKYIYENPVAAGLCLNAEDWPWSSARYFKAGSSGNTEPQLGRIEKGAKLELGAPGENQPI